MFRGCSNAGSISLCFEIRTSAQKDAHYPQLYHGVAPQEGKAAGGCNSNNGPHADGGRASCDKPSESPEQLAGGHGQDRRFVGLGRFARCHRSLVLGAGIASLGVQIHGEHRGL